MPPSARHRRLTRVVTLDRHPAFRFGVDALLKAEAGVDAVGGAATSAELWPLLRRVDPDVVLVDHDPGRSDRVVLSLRVRAGFRARVVLCATEPTPELRVVAELAGVDAIVDKADDPATLVAAV